MLQRPGTAVADWRVRNTDGPSQDENSGQYISNKWNLLIIKKIYNNVESDADNSFKAWKDFLIALKFLSV